MTSACAYHSPVTEACAYTPRSRPTTHGDSNGDLDMAGRQPTQRTVTFYEVVAAAGKARMGQQPWSDVISGLSRATRAERVLETLAGDELIGMTITYDDRDHLLLARVRRDDEWLERYKADTGEVEDLINDPESPFVTSSVVCFLPFGNIIGVIETTRSSPRATQIEAWINGMGWVDQETSVAPVIGSEALAKLRRAEEVSRLELTVRGPKLRRLGAKQGALGGMFRQAMDLGDVSVNMTITVRPGDARSEERRGLLHEVEEVAEELGTGGAAKAKLIYTDSSERARAEEVNFLKEKITAKKVVSFVDEDGQTVLRKVSAVRAILEAADEAETVLRGAVGLDPE